MLRRSFFVTLHRYLGLALAAFLISAGITGCVIAFRPELDAWLNPDLYRIAETGQKSLSPTALVERIEADDPRVRVQYLPLADPATQAAGVFVEPRRDPHTDTPFELTYDEVFINPVTGAITGKRLWGACCFEPQHVLPFILEWHKRLLLPGSWGTRLLGTVALLWMVLTIIGAYLTFPSGKPFLQKWKKAWLLKRGVPPLQNYLQWHRVGGLWFWLVLFGIAITGAAMNLEDEIFKPVVMALSPLTVAAAETMSGVPKISFDDALNSAQQHAGAHGIHTQPSAISYAMDSGLFEIEFGSPLTAGLGSSAIYVDAITGVVAGQVVPGAGTAGDAVMQLRYPLHTGRIAGMAGRMLIGITGLAVVLVSVTGVMLWWKKKRLRCRIAKRV